MDHLQNCFAFCKSVVGKLVISYQKQEIKQISKKIGPKMGLLKAFG